MTDVISQVQEMQHPMIAEMQARYEREIAEIRSEMQDKIDGLEEKVELAGSSVFQQDKFIDGLKSKIAEIKKGDPTNGIAPKTYRLSDLRKEFDTMHDPVGHFEKEWDVLQGFAGLLDLIEPSVEYVDRPAPTVYRIPPGLKNEVQKFISALENYTS